MGSDDPEDILSRLTRELAQQNDSFFPDEQGRREADSRLAKDIVEAFSRGVDTEDAATRFHALEANCLERARGGFHLNISALQPPGDTRRVPLKAVTIAQVLIESSMDAPVRTIVSVRSARAPADPWRPPPEFKYDRARKALTDLEQTIVAARSMKGSNEPWQPLPEFDYDPIKREWVGGKQRVVAVLASIIQSWMTMRSDGPPPPSSVTTTQQTEMVDVSG